MEFPTYHSQQPLWIMDRLLAAWPHLADHGQIGLVWSGLVIFHGSPVETQQ